MIFFIKGKCSAREYNYMFHSLRVICPGLLLWVINQQTGFNSDGVKTKRFMWFSIFDYQAKVCLIENILHLWQRLSTILYTVLPASEIQTVALKENYTYACKPRGFFIIKINDQYVRVDLKCRSLKFCYILR